MDEDKKKEIQHNEILSQYQHLRAEILQNDILVLQILAAALLLIGAAMGLAFNEKTHPLLSIVLFLGTVCLSFLAMNQSMERVKGTFMIATYLRKYLEPATTYLKWETKIQRFRESRRDEREVSILTSIMYTYLFISVSNTVLTIGYSIFFWERKLHNVLIFPKNTCFEFFGLGFLALVVNSISIAVTVCTIYLYRKKNKRYIVENSKTFKSL